MTYINNYYINEIFTGDLFLDTLENTICNFQEPGFFSSSFRVFSDVTGYIPHAIIDNVGFWTQDFNEAMRMIHSHDPSNTFWQNRGLEVAGILSIFLNGIAKTAGLSIRIILVVFGALSIPIFIGGVALGLTGEVPLALIISAIIGLLMLTGAGITKIIEGCEEQNPGIHEEIRRGIASSVQQHAGSHYNETVSVNGEEIIVASGFKADIPRNLNLINKKPIGNVAEAIQEILNSLDGDRKTLLEITHIFNQNVSIVLAHAIIAMYWEHYQDEKSKDEGYYAHISDKTGPFFSHLEIDDEKRVRLTITTEGDLSSLLYPQGSKNLEKKMHYKGTSVFDLNNRTVKSSVSFQEIDN